MKKKVGHYKNSNIAWSPDELAKCINKYSSLYTAVIVTNNLKYILQTHNSDLEIADNFSEIDIAHFHNKSVNVNIPKLIQYHSPYHNNVVDKNFIGLKTVIAQYHATLKEYKECKIVRNIIDFIDNDLYSLDYTNENIKVGFSPSVLIGGASPESKGYIQTKEVLERLKEKHVNFDYDIIINVSLDECIKRKSKCNIIIDEVVTKSYHRSGLEGLALGKMTICSLKENVIDVLKKASNSDVVPFENIWLNSLEEKLEEIINKGVVYIHEIGKKNRLWMEKHWNPKTIVNEFEEIYNTL